MSRRGCRSSDEGLLPDTSLLLPILGFETSSAIMEAFERLGFYTLHYSELSLLEASWKIVKVIKGSEEEISRVIEGVKAIRNTMNSVSIDEESFECAIKMYKLGHKDMIDNLLYSMAIAKKLRLLTVDKELIEFVRRHGLPRERIVTPEELSRPPPA